MIQLRFAANKAGFQAGGAGFAVNDAGSGAQAGDFAAGGGGCGQVGGCLIYLYLLAGLKNVELCASKS